jgi:hypothetical protein
MQVRYSRDHLYIIVEDDVGTVGITNHAQERLNEVTVVELPHVGAQVQKGGAAGVVESVKAASDLYSPVSGEILGVNEALTGKAKRRKLSELQGQHPMVLVLIRGAFCPKDRRQHEGVLELHREMEVGYCRLVTISTDNITETNEYRSGVGAQPNLRREVDKSEQC